MKVLKDHRKKHKMLKIKELFVYDAISQQNKVCISVDLPLQLFKYPTWQTNSTRWTYWICHRVQFVRLNRKSVLIAWKKAPVFLSVDDCGQLPLETGIHVHHVTHERVINICLMEAVIGNKAINEPILWQRRWQTHVQTDRQKCGLLSNDPDGDFSSINCR